MVIMCNVFMTPIIYRDYNDRRYGQILFYSESVRLQENLSAMSMGEVMGDLIDSPENNGKWKNGLRATNKLNYAMGLDYNDPKKPKTTHPVTAHVPPSASKNQAARGLLKELGPRIRTPSIRVPIEFIVVTTDNYQGILQHIYRALSSNLDIDPVLNNAGITKDDFVLVCRYLLRARCHVVFSKVLGMR